MTHSIRSRSLIFLLATFVAAGAARAQDLSASPTPPVQAGRWTGTLRQTPLASIAQGVASSRLSGSIDIKPSSSGAANSYRIAIRISSSGRSETLDWGMSRGRCGARLIMLPGANQMLPIEIGSSGSGEANEEIHQDFDPNAAYQLVIFKGGRSQQNIVACANLRLDEKAK